MNLSVSRLPSTIAYQSNYAFDGFPNVASARESVYVQENLFVNSDGFAVLLERLSSLFIRRTANGDNSLLCVMANNSEPYSSNTTDTAYLDIDFRLFTSENIRTVLDYVVHESGYIPRPTAIPTSELLFRHPFWYTSGSLQFINTSQSFLTV